MSTLTDLTEPTRERIGDARRVAESAGEQLRDRAEHLRGRVPELREDLEPVVLRARIGWWEAVGVLVNSLLVLPRAMVRGLGLLGEVLVLVSGRSRQLSERAREAAHRVGEPRRVAVKRRAVGVVWLLGAFFAGLGFGWLLARSRRDDELVFDPPVEPLPTTLATTMPATSAEPVTPGFTQEPSTEADLDGDAAADPDGDAVADGADAAR